MWIFVAIALLAAFSAWAQQPGPSPLPQPTIAGQPDHKAEESEQHTGTKKSGADQAPSIIKIPERENSEKETKTDSPHPPKETPKAEDWSLSDKIAAIASFMAFCQFIALVWTIWVMRFTAQRQLRAYVFVESALRKGPSQIDKGIAPNLVISFKNFGQTPASKGVYWVDVNIASLSKSGAFVRSDDALVGRFDLAPTASLSVHGSGGCNLSSEQTLAFMQGLIGYYVFGELKYIDAFAQERTTKFRLVYGIENVSIASFGLCEEGNEAT